MPLRETCQVRVRMTVSERQRLEDLAKASGKTITELVSRLVAGATDNGEYINVPVPAREYAKLHQMAKTAGLPVSDTTAALIRTAQEVLLVPSGNNLARDRLEAIAA